MLFKNLKEKREKNENEGLNKKQGNENERKNDKKREK